MRSDCWATRSQDNATVMATVSLGSNPRSVRTSARKLLTRRTAPVSSTKESVI